VAHLGTENDWVFVQTNYGFVGIVGFLIQGQHVFRPGDIFGIDFSHTPHSFPATV
jgi:hypothetical protein